MRLMPDTGVGGDENTLAGDFGERWVDVVAAACGMLHGPAPRPDLDKADVQLTLLEEVSGTYHPSVNVQVKTTHDLRVDEESGALVYDLDLKTYNVLRRTNSSIRRVLVVIRLAEDERVRLEEEGTLLVGRGAWVSLEGAPATANTTTIAVRLPAPNTLDPDGLRRMLTTFGVNRSTPVPEVDPWEEASA